MFPANRLALGRAGYPKATCALWRPTTRAAAAGSGSIPNFVHRTSQFPQTRRATSFARGWAVC
ncbi:Uncharacterised protein [Mycobacteroides abscessus subsp. abscessus]|nr:Uncharacterised protein [Mycobacteroides abscessus subsp. abscessus]